MPVIQVSLSRLKTRARNKVSEEELFEALPYVGLDIEDRNGDLVNVEYSPNRPDFCSEAGIARSLLGLLEIETGLPKYDFPQSNFRIDLDGPEILKVRPFIFGLYARLKISDETIRELIVMQEDLHNGLGRHRSKVAIGIHNAEMVKPQIKYLATDDRAYSFVPLGSERKLTIAEVLEKTEQGQQYGGLLAPLGMFPLLIDASGNVLSMPPIINGELTRLKAGVNSIFVDVTATERRVGEITIAIIASMLSDMGARVETVSIRNPEKESASLESRTPDMMPESMKFDLQLTNEILGLELSYEEARSALEKSRLELLSQDHAKIPKFRSDIIHPIDLAEEVMLGYGVLNLRASRSKSYLVGGLMERSRRLNVVIDVLVGLGFTEIESLALTSRNQLLSTEGEELRVEDPKSKSYEYLRGGILPSLLEVLAQSKHSEYPQKLFEQLQVFKRDEKADTHVREEEHVAATLAASSANYTQIRSLFDGFTRLVMAPSIELMVEPSPPNPIFASGRCASVSVLRSGAKTKVELGIIGEVSPRVLHELGLEVPVAAFELNLEPLLND